MRRAVARVCVESHDVAARIVLLRDVTEEDLPAFFEHQRDPAAAEMAAFPSRDRAAFTEHWRRSIGDDSVITKAVLVDGRVAGNVVSFERSGQRLVGYWLGRDYWGQGVATEALAAFLAHEPTRPLHARVAKHNIGSIRVLEKCGFTICGEDTYADEGGEGEEFIFELR